MFYQTALGILNKQTRPKTAAKSVNPGKMQGIAAPSKKFDSKSIGYGRIVD
jgi:hypothetical protein